MASYNSQIASNSDFGISATLSEFLDVIASCREYRIWDAKQAMRMKVVDSDNLIKTFLHGIKHDIACVVCELSVRKG